MTIDWTPPRCSHGHIILGCPHNGCPEQNEYLAKEYAMVDAYEDHQRREARRAFRMMLGLPVQ